MEELKDIPSPTISPSTNVCGPSLPIVGGNLTKRFHIGTKCNLEVGTKLHLVLFGSGA